MVRGKRIGLEVVWKKIFLGLERNENSFWALKVVEDFEK